MTKDELIKAGYQWFDNQPDTEAQCLQVVAALELDGHDSEIVPVGDKDPATGTQLYAVYVKIETDANARERKGAELEFLRATLPGELGAWEA